VRSERCGLSENGTNTSGTVESHAAEGRGDVSRRQTVVAI
jgi:hypothetical protein